MPSHPIVITECDRRRLENVVATEIADSMQSSTYLQDLQKELLRASIVASDEVPTDVVTMNSSVRLHDIDTGEVETYTLVFPNQANIALGKLSILAPVGTAILGYRVGDVVQWRVPSGSRRLRIEDVLYQPEREEMLQR